VHAYELTVTTSICTLAVLQDPLCETREHYLETGRD